MIDAETGPRFALDVRLKLGGTPARYRIDVSRSATDSGNFRIAREELSTMGGWEPIYTSKPPCPDPVLHQDDDTHLLLRMQKTGTQRKYGDRIAVRPDQPALTQIGEHKRVVRAHKDLAKSVMGVFANMRFLDLIPDRMRHAAFPGQTVLGRQRARTCRPCCGRFAETGNGPTAWSAGLASSRRWTSPTSSFPSTR